MVQINGDKFRMILDSVTDCILVWDKCYKNLYANQAAINHVGTTRDKVIGNTIREGLEHIPEFMHLWMSRIDKVIETGEPMQVEDLIPVGDNIVWSQSSLSPIGNEKGEIFAVVVIYRDVTDLKETESELVKALEAIRDERDRAELYLNIAGVMFVALDHEGCITMLNQKGLEILGYQEKEILGKNWFDLAIPEKSREIVKQVFNKTISGEVEPVEYFENPVITSSGNERLLAWHNAVLKDRDGKVIGTLSSGEDITELKQSEKHYRELFTNMPYGFAYHKMVLDSDDTPIDYEFIEINNAFEQLTGLDGENIIGRCVTEVIPGIKNDKFYWIGKYGQVAFGGEPIQFEQYSAALNRWFSVSAYSPKRGYFITVFSEITEMKKIEKELRNLNEELEERVVQRTAQLEATNRELEAFAYSVSHDLRAPLRSINGFSNALCEDYKDILDEIATDYLERIRSAAVNMGQLIEDMLELSRVTRVEMSKESVNLSTIAKSVVEKLRETYPKRKVSVKIPECIIAECDMRLMGLVLTNLFDNAWKFTRKKELAKIVFGYKPNIAGEDIFYVKDNGTGFDMKYADKLFRAFQRLHKTDEYEGTGIGLATIRRIISRHGGRVWAEGKVGKGATFYFTLPKTNGDE
jgi:PAS domain S-box-containing protein